MEPQASAKKRIVADTLARLSLEQLHRARHKGDPDRVVHQLADTLLAETTSYLFKWICCTQVFVYIEAGAIPAVLNILRVEFDMNFAEQGALGGVVYLFLSAACPFAGYLFRRYDVKGVMSSTLLCNAFATLLVALTPAGHAHLLIACRALIGASQAFLMVYAPVWVDEFAPAAKRTGWMSYMQASVPVGVMFGYLVATVATLAESCWIVECWRYAFIFQFMVTLPLAIASCFVPPEHFDIKLHRQHRDYAMGVAQSEIGQEIARRTYGGLLDPTARGGDAATSSSARPSMSYAGATASSTIDHAEDLFETTPFLLESPAQSPVVTTRIAMEPLSSSGRRLGSPSSATAAAHLFTPASPFPAGAPIGRIHRQRSSTVTMSTCQALYKLMSNPVYICTVIALTGLYFVVTGIQFWGTDFLITVIGGDKDQVRMAFIMTSITAPLGGVFAGGWIIDRWGGYQGADGAARSLGICSLFGLCAGCFAFPCTYLNSVPMVVLFLWVILFFGGAILPAATGVMISATTPDLRAFGSSFSVITFNLFGYFTSPVVSGWFMQVTGSFRLGFRLVLFSCGISIAMCILAWYTAWHQAQEEAKKPPSPASRWSTKVTSPPDVAVPSAAAAGAPLTPSASADASLHPRHAHHHRHGGGSSSSSSISPSYAREAKNESDGAAASAASAAGPDGAARLHDHRMISNYASVDSTPPLRPSSPLS